MATKSLGIQLGALSCYNSVYVTFRSTTEGLQEGVQQFDEEFEARLKGLKQQTQRSLVCFHGMCSCDND